MGTVMTNLATSVPTAVGDNLSTAVPFILAAFGIGIGAYILRKVLKGGAKMKFKI